MLLFDSTASQKRHGDEAPTPIAMMAKVSQQTELEPLRALPTARHAGVASRQPLEACAVRASVYGLPSSTLIMQPSEARPTLQ